MQGSWLSRLARPKMAMKYSEYAYIPRLFVIVRLSLASGSAPITLVRRCLSSSSHRSWKRQLQSPATFA